jgi:two-component system sensor kinase FixL
VLFDFSHRQELASVRTVLAICLVFAAGVALVDRFILPDFSFGILYVVPLMVAAFFLKRWQILAAAVTATFLREQFGSAPWHGDALARVSMGLLAFSGASLFVYEMVRRKQCQAESVRRIAEQETLRHDAAEEARALIEGSPAAILTINPDGRIGLANEAARRLLGFDSDSPEGEPIGPYLPTLSDLLKSRRAATSVRAMVEGSGRRRNGDMFLAQMWLSSYKAAAGTKLAAIFMDVSQQLRDREELGLRQLLTNSRIIVGAVSHEIRNLAAAIGVLHDRMAKSDLAEREEFQALGRLIDAMRKLASAEVPAPTDNALAGVDLHALLQELNIIVSSSFDEAKIELKWEIAEGLSRVRVDHSGLLQVLLNLVQNSRRALKNRANGRVTVAAYQMGGSVVVRFWDNGPGLSSSDNLFQPFQPGAISTGLGLYVSRAIVRTYGGELQYAKKSGEGCFIIELPAMSQDMLKVRVPEEWLRLE